MCLTAKLPRKAARDNGFIDECPACNRDIESRVMTTALLMSHPVLGYERQDSDIPLLISQTAFVSGSVANRSDTNESVMTSVPNVKVNQLIQQFDMTRVASVTVIGSPVR